MTLPTPSSPLADLSKTRPPRKVTTHTLAGSWRRELKTAF